MRVTFKFSSEDRISWDVDPEDRIDIVGERIYYNFGAKTDEQRFIFRGKSLDQSRTFRQYGIEDGSEVHVGQRLRGMISTFTSNDLSDPLVNYLMMTDEEREGVSPPIEELREMARAKGAVVDRSGHYVDDPDILHDYQRRLLCDLLDFMWDRTAASSDNDRVDMRLIVPYELLIKVLSPLDLHMEERYSSEKLVGKFETQYWSVPGASSKHRRLALRMTKATNSCINFHCDGTYATSTSQIPLNPPTEYKGGSLCFFAKDKVIMVARTVGSVVGHSPKVLHGVTRVTEGVRKSMFILDDTNNLGTGGVYELRPIMCDAFLASPAMLHHSVAPAAAQPPVLPAPPPVPEESVDDEDVHPEYGTPLDLVMSQTGCSRAEAVNALLANDDDVVNAIMCLRQRTTTRGTV